MNYLKHPAVPFVLPLMSYIIIQLIGSKIHPDAKYVTFPIATAACIIMVFYFIRHYPKLFEFKKPLATIGVGMVAAILWIAPYDHFVAKEFPDPRAGFNPGAVFPGYDQIILCSLAMRVFGSVITIAMIEEIFWRGFLQRYLVNEDFQSVPLGKYTLFSFWGTAAMVILIHANQWQVALPWALLSTGWYIYTKSLGSMILLHAVTNLGLAIYVLQTGKFYFW